MQFKIFYCNSKYSIYDSDHLLLQQKKMCNIQFLAKTIAIYSSKKRDFDSKNNYRDGKLARFWIINS